MTAPVREKRDGPGQPQDPALLPDDAQGWENFDKLLMIQCTLREVAAFFERSDQWVRLRVKDAKGMTFEEYAGQVRPRGKVSLRRKQFELAMAGDRTMLIWLGKQFLGQADKHENRLANPDGTPLTIGEQIADPARLVLEGLAQIRDRHLQAQSSIGDVHDAHPLRQIASNAEQTRDLADVEDAEPADIT